MKHPEQAALLEETYDEMESSLVERITGLQNQITLNQNRRNLIIRVNRKAKTALQIFDEILEKDHLDNRDLGLLVEEILIYTDHIDVKLKADIDALLNSGTVTDAETGEAVNFKRGTKGQVMLLQRSKNTRNRAFCVNTISDGDPLEIYTDRDGEVILKKYSPIGEMSSFAKDYTESLFRSLGHIACIVDRDQVVAASGVSKKELWDKPISPDLESAIQARQTVASSRLGGGQNRARHQRGGRVRLYGPGGVAYHRRRRGHRRGAAPVPGTGRPDGGYRGESGGNRRRHRGPADGAVIPGSRDLKNTLSYEKVGGSR